MSRTFNESSWAWPGDSFGIRHGSLFASGGFCILKSVLLGLDSLGIDNIFNAMSAL